MDFTKRQPVTKSIKFALRPVKATEKVIREKQLLEKDRLIHEQCEKLCPVYDRFVKNVINNAFLSYGEEIVSGLSKLSEEESDKKQKDSTEKKMQKFVRKFFDEAAPCNISSMTSKSFFDHAKLTQEEKTILQEVSGCTTYLTKFAKNRISLFDTAAKRTVENYFRFLENVKRLKEFLVYAVLDDNDLIEKIKPMVYEDYYELCLTSEDIQTYNLLITGTCDEKGIIKKGLNQIINELNQKNKTDRSYNGPIFRLLLPLYQQILFPKDKMYQRIKLESDSEVREVVTTLKKTLSPEKLDEVIDVFRNADDICISGKKLHQFSFLIFGDHHLLPNLEESKLREELEEQLPLATTREKKRLEKEIDKVPQTVKKNNYSLKELESLVEEPKNFKAELVNALIEKKNRIKNPKDKQELITYFNALTDFYCVVKIFFQKEENAFLSLLRDVTKDFRLIGYTNNLVLAYFTKKPKDIAKESQICFGLASKLKMEWWNGEKVSTKNIFFLKKDGIYYVATMTPGRNGFDSKILLPSEEEDHFDLYLQKKSQPSYQRLPQITFKEAKEYFKDPDAKEFILTTSMKHPVHISRKVYEIYANKSYKTEGLDELIKLYKTVAQEYVQYDRFHFEWSEHYKNLNEFFQETDCCTVYSEWRKISAEKLMASVEQGQLLLFKVWQRKLYKGKTNNSYVNTFRALFSDENIQTNDIRLNSNPTISFRPATIPKNLTHKKGSVIVGKRTKDGEKVPASVYHEIYDALKKADATSVDGLSKEAQEWLPKLSIRRAKKDLIKDKRYTKDQFFISINYTKNAKVPDAFNPISQEVRDEMKDGFYTMSIGRGVSNLLYYIVYDPDHKIVEEGPLNEINGINYADDLKKIDAERKNGKSKKWDYDQQVKNTRNSFIDAAITKLLSIAFSYHAVIVVEKIDPKLKQKWSCIDNQIFSVFEKKLQAKLMDYHVPGKKPGEPGSVENPIQATYDVSDKSIQNGILFMTNGSYISSVDPYTGFINLFSFSHYNGTKRRKEFFSRFQSITYKNGFFYFTFDYNDFPEVKHKPQKSVWTVKAGGKRMKYDREKKKYYLDPDIAQEAVETFCKEDPNWNGEILMSSKCVNALFDLFKTAVLCTKIEKECLISPIIGESEEKISFDHSCTDLLAKKMWFFLDWEGQEYVKDWIDFEQKIIGQR